MHRSIAVLSFVIALAGCHSSSQPLRSADQAVTQYKQALATTCGGKHMDAMSPVQLNVQTRLWYGKLDAPARDNYDKAVRDSCAANGSQPECYNTGILRGVIQDGGMDKFVTQVCGSVIP